jgi:hypothetical protein
MYKIDNNVKVLTSSITYIIKAYLRGIEKRQLRVNDHTKLTTL